LLADLTPPGAVYGVADLPTPGGTPVVLALPSWSPAVLAAISERIWQEGGEVLPVRLDGGTVLVGPVLRPGAVACLACVEYERLITIGGRTPYREPNLRVGGVLAPTALPAVGAVVRAALADPTMLSGTVWILRYDGTCSTHPARNRRDGCPICSPRPDDGPEAVRFVPAARPLPDPFLLRVPNPATTLEGLRDALVDNRFGPIVRLSHRDRMGLATAVAEVGGASLSAAGYGRAATFAQAERIALFEAVERLTGRTPRGRRTTVRASYRELGDRAVDPVTLGLPETRYHGHPAFHCGPYHPDLRTTWVYGWSMRHQRALAVPEHAAYWGPLPEGRPGAFLPESSNGCGLGNNLEEAVLYGLCEIAERDAFLMAWYAATPLRTVALPNDDDTGHHLADLLDQLGYDLMLFDATNDLGIPAVLGLALHRDPESAAPQAFFSAGAHPDPRAAIHSTVVEIVVNVCESVGVAQANPSRLDRNRLLPMLDDPELVVTMDDHMALYSLPEARPRYDFLVAGRPEPVDPREIWPDQPHPIGDLGAYLTELVDSVTRSCPDVIVVDQTDPVIRDRLGLHSAKVIVPGTLPMTFGHVHRRTRGLPRLLEVPARLGRRAAPLVYDELPWHPHPFP
jgi:ribosomal protein S12 methylthiotransferase accessory factor